MKTNAVDSRLLQRMEEAVARMEDVDRELSDPAVAADPESLRRLGMERSELEPIVRAAEEIRRVMDDHRSAQALAEESNDPEMLELAREEMSQLEERLSALAADVRELLIPQDPLEDRPAVVEVRAGTGGDEAGLFAGDLLRMYRRLAERKGWSVDLISLSEGIPGSVKEVIFTVQGKRVYGQMRFESGVHRVQRVPQTESSGRIHTSAATVAVLPEAEEVDLKIDPSDLRIDVFRSSGPGGQSVNTTYSAVRLTHEPTGIVVTCQDQKSQIKNFEKALVVLRSRIYEIELEKHNEEVGAQRRSMVGSGDRSDKIRTYNYPQGRVTDHRIGYSQHNLPVVMDGEIAEFIEKLRIAENAERLSEGSTS